MGGWVDETVARSNYTRVVEAIRDYPWEEVGAPCWVGVVRLLRMIEVPLPLYLVVVAHEFHAISNLPNYVPHPEQLSELKGVYVGSYGWITKKGPHPYHCSMVEEYFP